MRDFSELTDRVLRGLGKAYAASTQILNVPGRSVAVKIDHHYYLAIWPAFAERIGRYAAALPRSVAEALVHSGNLISTGPERRMAMPLRLAWPGGTAAVNGAFLLAHFVERGLSLYGGAPDPLPVSPVRIFRADQAAVLDFFAGKTPPHDSAFTPEA
ncbi:MAG: hypothetical protein AB1916_01905 [Thermodesulfobacteriota bacterium]